MALRHTIAANRAERWCGMTATLGSYGQQAHLRSTETFDTLNPATSEVIATFGVYGEQDVSDAVKRADAIMGKLAAHIGA